MSDRLTILVIVGTRTDPHSLRSQVEMAPESHCLLGQFERIFSISYSEAELKVEKSGGVVVGEGTCEDEVVGLPATDRRSSENLSVKKEAKCPASGMPGAEEGKGGGDLRSSSLLTVCQSRLELSEDEEMRLDQ